MSQMAQPLFDDSSEMPAIGFEAGSPIKARPAGRKYKFPSYKDRIGTRLTADQWKANAIAPKAKAKHVFELDHFEPYAGEIEIPANLKGKYKGRANLNDVWKLVGSKAGRAIYKDPDYMSEGTLNILNGKRIARGQKPYLGTWESVDEDAVPEFVVRDHNKNIVAVNGYTTKRSDWDIMNKYYTQYPSRDDRHDNPFRDFVNDYYEDDPDVKFETDAAGFPTDEYLERRKAAQKNSIYSMRLPNPTAYNIFTKNLVSPIIKLKVNELAEANGVEREHIMSLLKDAYGEGWMLSFISQLWNGLVKTPFLTLARNTKEYKDYFDAFQLKHRNSELTEKEKQEKFIKSFMNLKGIKLALKKWISPMLTKGNAENIRTNQIITVEVAKLLNAIQSSISQADN